MNTKTMVGEYDEELIVNEIFLCWLIFVDITEQ